MTALKSLEVVNLCHYPFPNYSSRRSIAAPRCCFWEVFSKVKARFFSTQVNQELDAEEILLIRVSLNSLHSVLRSWAKYVPALIPQQLYSSGVEAMLSVLRCETTIFFCDLQDFRSVCCDCKPQDALEILNCLYNTISSTLENYDGTLLEFIGEEVLAIFNAPAQVKKHNVKAITAMVEIEERLSVSPLGGMGVRLGVHTAKVLVGNIGSPTRMKFGALGDGVNTTARLKSLNSRYGTKCLVSDTTLRMNGGYKLFLSRPVGKVVLKGHTRPTLVAEVLGLRLKKPAWLHNGAQMHQLAFSEFVMQKFEDARKRFSHVHDLFMAEEVKIDRPSKHLLTLCNEYLAGPPPPPHWEGEEVLTAK